MSGLLLQSESPEEQLSKAIGLYKGGDFPGAVLLFQDGMKRFDDIQDRYKHPMFRKEYLRMLLQQRLWEKAELFVADARLGDWHLLLFARAYAAANDLPNAALWWGRVIASNPSDPEAINWFTSLNKTIIQNLIEDCSKTGKPERLYSFVETHFPDFIPFFWRADTILGSHVRECGAVQRHFQYRALEAASNHDELLLTLRAAIRSGNADIAREASFRLMQSLKESPTSDEKQKLAATLLSGDAHLCAGDLNEAERFYGMATQISPASVAALLGSAMTMLDRGDLNKCAKFLSDAISKGASSNNSVLPGLLKYFYNQIVSMPEKTFRPGIDLLIFSHATERMTRNKHLAPPCTEMIAGIVREARRRTSEKERLTSTIMFDHRDTALSEDYRANLRKLADTENIELIVNTRNGLRRQWIDGVARGTGEFLLIIEQDHEILPECPSWGAAIELMRKRPDISYIRFNRRKNIRINFDVRAYQTNRDVRDGLTRTTKHSNTPHLVRRSFYTNIIHPIIANNGGMDRGNDGAAGVEENINVVIDNIEQLLGYPVTSRLFGLAIWGGFESHPTTRTIGF